MVRRNAAPVGTRRTQRADHSFESNVTFGKTSALSRVTVCALNEQFLCVAASIPDKFFIQPAGG